MEILSPEIREAWIKAKRAAKEEKLVSFYLNLFRLFKETADAQIPVNYEKFPIIKETNYYIFFFYLEKAV